MSKFTANKYKSFYENHYAVYNIQQHDVAKHAQESIKEILGNAEHLISEVGGIFKPEVILEGYRMCRKLHYFLMNGKQSHDRMRYMKSEDLHLLPDLLLVVLRDEGVGPLVARFGFPFPFFLCLHFRTHERQSTPMYIE